MRVGIAGGGLGGLSAALFLLRAGVGEVRVFEQQRELSEIGAGIQIAPNAVRLLQRLGLGDALAAVSVAFEDAWEFRRWEDGRILFSQTYGAEGEARFGAPYIAVHRADLLRVLADALPAGVVSLGRRVSDVDGARFVFADGSASEPFDALIGADGIHSVVRDVVAGPGSPVFTGLAAYRALVPADEAPEFARRPVCSIWLGPKRHFVHYPVSGGAFVNLVTANPAGDWREESWTAPGEVADFLAEYAGWDAAVQQLIGAARETKRYAFYAREPITSWVSGRIALLGDAAHPMLPFFAQGAGQAIEDGAVLARCLVDAPVDAALRRYESLRVDRATRVQRLSGARREHHHMEDGPEQEARDLALSAQDPLGHNEWLYGHDVEAGL
ncbi:FAD-dependent monooxygenase [Solirubrobacter soli]|uniref:FAD-dependent monooxygenase n=1 Tax=Solirubrobacter soli TaxID=363832 RepID=UPI0004165BCC|nr:FAD-dependent monooxygenase [Solirubrobacter soli]